MRCLAPSPDISKFRQLGWLPTAAPITTIIAEPTRSRDSIVLGRGHHCHVISGDYHPPPSLFSVLIMTHAIQQLKDTEHTFITFLRLLPCFLQLFMPTFCFFFFYCSFNLGVPLPNHILISVDEYIYIRFLGSESTKAFSWNLEM